MDFELAKKRTEELTAILNDCIEKYYMGNESDVSDYDYDMMMRELSELEDEEKEEEARGPDREGALQIYGECSR